MCNCNSPIECQKILIQELSAIFGFLPEISSMGELVSAAKKVVSAYPEDFELQLEEKLFQFSSHKRNCKDLNASMTMTERGDGWEISIFKELPLVGSTYPNIKLLLKIYLCLMCTNGSRE